MNSFENDDKEKKRGGKRRGSRFLRRRVWDIARLDRFLYFAEWEEFFKNIKQMVMPRVTLDHCPILLQCGDSEKQRPYFKFENWWLEIDGFRELVHKWWNEFEVIGCLDYVLSLKLRMLKKKITEWSKLVCGGLDTKKRNLLAELADIDLIQDTRALNEDEMIVRATVLVELEKLAKNEEARWRQKSRVLWLQQGDNNTIFFQRMATAHKRYNAIDKLVIRGEEIKDPDQIKVSMIEFYKNLYSESEGWRPAFGIANCPRISQEDQEWLQRPFTEVEGAEELKDFRPISLIGGVYKIIGKLITERMKKVMGTLVDEHQMAFLKGRQIMDATLLANELVDSRVKQNVPGVLCKLDIEKAYDHVNWVFLLKIFRDMRFGNKWINWISFCISTVKFSLIINGSPEGFFQSQRGLRQGDPMSPFLFILAMEGLNFMIRRARENGWIRGFCANRNMGNAMEISDLLYADDSLVFCEAEVTQIRHLRAILTIFECVSGLHVNWQKSCLYLVNQVPNMQILAENLGCQVASLPTKYLGMPLGAKNKELEVWNEILQRSERKLARWKSQYLSLGGRLTLIKSVMDGQPTYMMSLFPLPVSIEKKINKARRVFLWQGNKEKKGYNLVKWDK
ncbi:hypothetical protein MTR67_039294, partial [Solanum verrucosum]